MSLNLAYQTMDVKNYLSVNVVVQFLIVDSVSLVYNRNNPTEARLFYLSPARCLCVASEC